MSNDRNANKEIFYIVCWRIHVFIRKLAFVEFHIFSVNDVPYFLILLIFLHCSLQLLSWNPPRHSWNASYEFFLMNEEFWMKWTEFSLISLFRFAPFIKFIHLDFDIEFPFRLNKYHWPFRSPCWLTCVKCRFFRWNDFLCAR